MFFVVSFPDTKKKVDMYQPEEDVWTDGSYPSLRCMNNEHDDDDSKTKRLEL